MKKIIMLTLFFTFLFGSMASAHVSVNPATSVTGAWETYTVKVPVEKETATTKFTLKMPSGVQYMSYQPVAGWNLSTQKDENGNVKSITFEAIGEGILPGQFQQFVFVAKNPNKATDAPWDAFQFYKDGTIVEWTGGIKDKTPHSITKIVNGTTGESEHHSTSQNTQPHKELIMANKEHNSMQDNLPISLSIISVLLSFFAVYMGLRKRV